MKTQHFEKYASRLTFEALVKSLLLSLAIGFGANFIAAIVAWFTIEDNLALALIITLGALVLTTLVCTPIFYFAKFRPTEKSSARRIDRVGLEERLITMVEYKDDQSTIARLQREDAERALANVEKSELRMRISKKVVATVLAATLIGGAMTTVSALAAAGLMPSGYETIDGMIPDEPIVYVNVVYIVEEGGFIDGIDDQIIALGESTSPVLAVAEDGWAFMGWDDGSKRPERYEKNVETDITLTAIFAPVGDGNAGFPGEDGPPMDEPGDTPGEDGPPDPDSDMKGQAGGTYSANNQVLDGETNYNLVIGDFYEAAMESLANGSKGSSEEAEDAGKNYYEIID